MTQQSPPPSTPAVSKSMRSNKSKGTGPERALAVALRDAGVPKGGYRLNVRGIPGTPDLAFIGIKLAIFVNGCFWHRCPKCSLSEPKSHPEFWRKKFERNVQRDAENLVKLKKMGWRTLVIWECELKDSPESVASRVKDMATLRCERCGSPFLPRNITVPRYCTRSCGGQAVAEAQRGRVSERVCVECGTKFSAPDYYFMTGRNERKYCSSRCLSRLTQRRVYWRRKDGKLPGTSRKFQRQIARRKKAVPGFCRDCSSPLVEGERYTCTGCRDKRRDRRMFR